MLRFERNELDVERYELRRMGRRQRLPRVPMELLLLLIERRNRLVTRQEIAEHLWSQPESVDVVQGINSAINRLRAVLNDDSAKPRCIETVIGKGYRFIADIEEIPDVALIPAPAPILTVPPANGHSPLNGNGLHRPEILVEEAEDHRDFVEPEEAVLEYPATRPASLAPIQALPQRGPIARRWVVALVLGTSALLVAFFIYRLRTSTHPQPPVFNQLTFSDGDDRITASAISPDGKLLAYADSSGVLLRVVRSGAEQLLASPPTFRVDRITWFADDLRLAVSGFESTTLKPQIWLVSVTGKPARILCDGARNGTPSPDGDSFLFTSNQDADIWVGEASGGEPRLVVSGAPGVSFPYAFWAADSRHLMYQRKQYAPLRSSASAAHDEMEKQYRWTYESADAASGQVITSVPEIRFDSAALLPGGRLLFLRWDHVGKRQSYSLWEVLVDPSNGKFRASPHILTTFPNGTAASLSASADGDEIAAVLDKDYASVAIADLGKTGTALGNPHRLTHDLQSDYPHAWMPGSDAILFESSRNGRFEIYRQQLGSRTAEMIADLPHGSFMPQVAPGGRWILFAVQKNATENSYSKSSLALFRIPVSGGNATEVPIGGPLEEFRCPLAPKGGCVLRQTLGHQQLVYHALDPETGIGPELGRTAWTPTLLGDWDVSPDAGAVAFPVHDSSNRSIHIVPLNGGSGRWTEKDIPVDTFAGVSEVSWAADGHGFYAGSTTDAGCDLLYIDLQGHATVLKKGVMGTWGVPSPDGNKLAFVDYRIDSNVWMSDQRGPLPDR